MILLIHISGIGLISGLSFPGKHAWLWVLFIAYYWFFYFRLMRFALWTTDTLDLVQQKNRQPVLESLEEAVQPACLPNFVVIVPAYGAGRSIWNVAAVLSQQRYPRQHWRAIFVTDLPECEATQSAASKVAVDLMEALQRQSAPRRVTLDEAALLLFAADGGAESSATYLTLFKAKRRDSVSALMALNFNLAVRGHGPESSLPSEVRDAIGKLVQEAERKAQAMAASIREITGARGAITRCFPVMPNCKIDGRLHTALLTELQRCSSASETVQARLATDPELEGRLRAAYELEHPSTTAAIRGCLYTLDAKNIHECLRPRGVRNKAAALNFGFAEAERRGWIQNNTHILVLDCDSFTHVNALALTALEILHDLDNNVIRQLLPVTVTNFNERNWLVRSIIAADSIAMPGRWARSVRTQSRADLTAGSGVIIPALFLKYVMREYGEAWDTKIVCEDARLILSQYAMLDGASKRTKMVPSFVLEAAPEMEGAWNTYKALWRQRMRWALGGMDEVAALFRVSDSLLMVGSRSFLPRQAGPSEYLTAKLRKYRLLLLWLSDHLWWSGTTLAPVLWLVTEIVCGPLRWALRAAGLALLLLLPLFLVRWVFLGKVRNLVPGGVVSTSRTHLVLFLCLLAAGWACTWPVVAAQIMVLLGRRRSLGTWNPATPKPRN